MYQYEFFLKKFYQRHPKLQDVPPASFISLNAVDYIRSSYWAEHCLECSEPLCYGNCEHYIRRSDNRCKRFVFGIYDNPAFKDYPYHAEISFRKWAKLETIVRNGTISPKEALSVEEEFRKKCHRQASRAKWRNKDVVAQELQAFDAEKYAYSERLNQDVNRPTDTFLFQAYSYNEQSYHLFFEITADADLVYRETIVVKPGFNQALFDLKQPFDVFASKGVLRAKIYPENDFEANLVLLFNEFVQLKSGDTMHKGIAAINSGVAMEQTQSISDPAAFVKVKCVIWDLDNTLWDGILIESDPDTLALRPGVLDVMRALDQRGVLQAIASKNTESEVNPVLKRLGIDHLFVAAYINWRPKSQNIANLAKSLNIDSNSFAFIDDSVLEREEIKHILPEVRVFDQTDISTLLSLPDFDIPVTDVSKKRRTLYQTEAQRQSVSENFEGSNLDFLASCQLIIEVSRVTSESERLRCYELVQRTNQLNLSGKKYDKEAFYNKLAENSDYNLIIKCHDRFGDYGQVGYVNIDPIIGDSNTTLRIAEYALSCRVAQKYVETALISWIFDNFKTIDTIQFDGVKTPKNGLLINTFTELGFSDNSTDDSRLLFEVTRDTKLKGGGIVGIDS